MGKRFGIWPWELKKRGVMGMNARNLLINNSNCRTFYPRVDNKVLTKELCKMHEVPVPETYAVIERLGDISHFHEVVAQRAEFVVKPARGAGGRGIIVIAKHDGDHFETPGGKLYPFPQVRYRIATILSGLYSLGGLPDHAIIEQRIKPHSIFEKLAVAGTPDLRIILYQNQPVLAMLRLPTNRSGGRANLHQGAVGVGVDIETGKTCGGVFCGRMVTDHPDTGASMQGLQVPQWEKVIDIAIRLSTAIELGYVGVDVVMDVDLGPLVLEANARPGLAIQVANHVGLHERFAQMGIKEI